MFSGSNDKNGWGQSTGFSGIQLKPSTGGLFGNSNSGGLFGNSKSGTSNLNSASTNQNTLFNTGSLNNTLNTNPLNANTASLNTATNSTSHPYVSNSIFQGIPTNYEMPASITGDLFSNDSNSSKQKSKPLYGGSSDSKPSHSSGGGSLFSRIAGRLNIFKTGQLYGDRRNKIQGIFSSTDFPSTKHLNKDSKNRITKPLKFNLMEARSTSSTKKLIIKSNPSKFHLINADKVLDSRRKRVITSLLDEPEDDSDFELPSISPDKKRTVSRIINGSSERSELGGTKKNIVIKQGDYYTSPSIEELSSWTLKDLASIDNFVVGRKGFGRIAFNQPVDLSDMKRECNEENKELQDELFNETVEIGNKYVKVYKEGKSKPPRGFGINVPATITLENIEPNQGKDLSSFINSLKNKEGMEFVTYDPIMFMWVFKVQHFSIWGLADENGNDIDLSRNSDEQEYLKELKRQKVHYETKDLPGNWGAGAQDSILKFKKNLLSNEISSQIDIYRETPTLRSTNSIPNDDILDDPIEEDTPEPAPVRENYEYLRQLVSVLPTNIDFSEIVQEKAYEPEINDESAFSKIQPRPNVAVSDDWLVQLELTNEFNSALAKHLADNPIKIQEDGKLQLELIDALLFGKKNDSSVSSKDVSTPLIKSDEGIEENSEIPNKEQLIQDINKILPKLLSVTKFEKRSNGYSKAVSLACKFSEISSIDGFSPKLQRFFSLCSALFDRVEPGSDDMIDDSITDHITSLRQRDVLVKWLKDYNEDTVLELLATAKDSFEKIFIYICAGDIKEAIKTAIDTKNNQLGAVLTFADSNFDGIQKLARAQIEDWATNDFIPANLIKIYKFMAGDLDEVLSDFQFPWNIRLAAKICYLDVNTRLADTVGEVVRDLDENSDEVEILKFYCDYDFGVGSTEYENTMSIKSSNLDVFHKWVFLRILGGNIDDSITISFARLVEKLGLWKESLFVYTHLVNNELARDSTTAVVKDNIKQIKNDQTSIDEEPYLVNILKVPSNLIYESVATTEMDSSKNYRKACDAFITANAWEKAHECIVDNLGPKAVISKDIAGIRLLQRTFTAFPQQGTVIPEWSRGAGLYQNYFSLFQYFKDGRVPSEKAGVVEELLNNLRFLHPNTIQTKVAACIMAKDIGDFALGLKLPDLKNRILALPLGENERTYFESRLNVD